MSSNQDDFLAELTERLTDAAALAAVDCPAPRIATAKDQSRRFGLAIAASILVAILAGTALWAQLRSTDAITETIPSTTSAVPTPVTPPGATADDLPGTGRLGSLQWVQSILAEQRDQDEVAIASCMDEAGFAYTPLTNAQTHHIFSPDPTLSDADFVMLYGWGWSTRRKANADGGLEFLQNLSEERKQESTQWIASLGACIGEHNSGGGPLDEPAQTATAAAFGEVIMIQRSALYTDVEADWAACISAFGYEYRTIRDAETALSQANSQAETGRSNAITGGQELADQEFAEVVEAEIEFAQISLTCGVRPPYLGPPQAIEAEWDHRMQEAITVAIAGN